MQLNNTLTELAKKTLPSKPVLFSLANEQYCARIQEHIKEGDIRFVSDDYEEQLREYFAVSNPTLVFSPHLERHFKAYCEERVPGGDTSKDGMWAWYPWNATLVHVLPHDEFYQVRTARNKNLITAEEQDKFYNATIGIAGLSVGNSVALAIALQGGGRKMKLADMDRLALSNTNRVRASIASLGVLKVEMTARQIYELNPYAEIEIHSEGLTPENIESFFDGLDIVIDEIDNLAVKHLIREQARAHKIAVVMGADNGDNAVIDIERYDIHPHVEFFHGRLGETSYEHLSSLDKFGIGKHITKHVGPENVTTRMQASLLEMGKTIVSWPQLGGAALVNGAAVALAVRKVLTGESLESNRAIISLDEKLIPEYHSPEAHAERSAAAEAFKKIFGL